MVTIQSLPGRRSPALFAGGAARFPAALLVLLALSTACTAGTAVPAAGPQQKAPAAQVAPPAPPALVGERVTREIGGEEIDEHRIDLPAATYARVTAEQAAIDIALELRGPDGAVLARVDSPGGHRVPELLSWIAPMAGSYQLIVKPHDPQAPRDTYVLTLEEVRPAVASDEMRVALERAGADARQRSFSERVEDRRKALEDLEQVLAAWRASGDRLGVLRTLNDRAHLQILLGDNDAALASLTPGLEEARALGDRRELARALDLLGLVVRKSGGTQRRVLDLYTESLHLWRELGDRAGEADVLYNLGVLHADEGDSAGALDFYAQALELHKAAHELAQQAFTLAAIGLIQRDRGEVEKALASFDAFSYSKKKDYVEWLNEAKTDATRKKRLETAVEWIAQGKGRNWKYERK